MRVFLALCVLASVAVAAEAPAERHAFEKDLVFAESEGAPADAAPVSAWGAFGSFVGYTLVIILLLCGLVYAARRFVPGARSPASTRAIELLGRRILTPGASLFLVQVGRRVLRVGVSRDGMSYLGEVADPDEVAVIRGQCLGESEENAFREALKSKAPAERPAAEPAEPLPPAPLNGELERIRKVVEGWRVSA